MVSKRIILTVALLLLTQAGCTAIRQMMREIANQEDEINVSFRIADNLLYLRHAEIEGREGRFIVASSLRNSILDESFGATLEGSAASILIRGRSSVRFEPEIMTLDGPIDGLIGSDILGPIVTIDYYRETISIRRSIETDDADLVHDFVGQPSLTVSVGSREVNALVDTANPDTFHIPASWIDDGGEPGQRITRDVSIGNIALGEVDLLLVERGPARIGNRVLSRFLVGIDYGGRQVVLWDSLE